MGEELYRELSSQLSPDPSEFIVPALLMGGKKKKRRRRSGDPLKVTQPSWATLPFTLKHTRFIYVVSYLPILESHDGHDIFCAKQPPSWRVWLFLLANRSSYLGVLTVYAPLWRVGRLTRLSPSIHPLHTCYTRGCPRCTRALGRARVHRLVP